MNSLCIMLTLPSKSILMHRNALAGDLDSNLKFTTIVQYSTNEVTVISLMILFYDAYTITVF